VLRAFAAAATLTVALSGCGAHGHTHAGAVERGSAVFVGACARCHTLTGHDSAAPGGDLATVRLSTPAIESFVHVMPVHLTGAEIAAVAAYVHAEAARSAR
jgi:mono/diheme cytochrome c family protein